MTTGTLNEQTINSTPTSQPPGTSAPTQKSTPSPLQVVPPIGSQQSTSQAPPPATNLDPQIVTLAQTIKGIESQGNYNAVGDNGSSMGAYQWNNGPTPVQPGQTPKNWQTAAQQYLGNSAAPMSPENQNYVAYHQIADYKAKGLSPNSIDALWNGARPDPANPGQYTHISTQRASTFNTALQQEVQNNPSVSPAFVAPEAPPSVGGFLGNVVKSGANFAGNLINAVVHPIQTVQALGGATAGAFQELGGQTNTNTAEWDAVKNYFGQRYNSPQALLHSLYSDPIGVAADASAVLGGVGLVAGATGKIAEASTVADAARAAELAGSTGIRTMAGDVASGNALTRGANTVSDTAGTVSNAVNPLTPVIGGISKVIGGSGLISSELGSQLTGLEPQTIDAIIRNPSAFTTEQIANSSRVSVAQQVEDALNVRMEQLSETGSGYNAIRQSGTVPEGYQNIKNVPPANAIPVEQGFIENQLRTIAKVDVHDGKIIPKGSSVIRASKDVRALQNLLDTWKPEFQKGYLTPEEFLNFRQDLAAAAKYDREFSTSKPVEGVAAGIRDAFNTSYRSSVPGLESIDTQYATQIKELTALRKGLIDKNGNLLESAINKIANATGKGKDAQLARLEELVPGITKKLGVLKAMEDIQKIGGTKVGTYPSAFLKAGGVLAGIATGNIWAIGAAASYMIIASPDIAVPLLRLLGGSKEMTSAIMAHLAKYLTLGAVNKAATSGSADTIAPTVSAQSTPQEQVTPTIPSQTQSPQQSPLKSVSNSNSSYNSKLFNNFDYQAAKAAGYSDAEIDAFLATQSK